MTGNGNAASFVTMARPASSNGASASNSGVTRLEINHVLNVAAQAEAFPCPRDHQHTHVAVRGHSIECLDQSFAHVARERALSFFRAVERDRRDAIGDREQDRGVAHTRSHQHRHPLPAAHAQRRDAVAALRTRQLVHQAHRDARAAAAGRVPERDRRRRSGSGARGRTCSSRSQASTCDANASFSSITSIWSSFERVLLEQLPHGGHRADAHARGIHARRWS